MRTSFCRLRLVCVNRLRTTRLYYVLLCPACLLFPGGRLEEFFPPVPSVKRKKNIQPKGGMCGSLEGRARRHHTDRDFTVEEGVLLAVAHPWERPHTARYPPCTTPSLLL